MIADVLFLISVVTVVLLKIFDINNSIAIIFAVICMIFFVHLHCILNGRTYRLLKHYNKKKNRYKRERRK